MGYTTAGVALFVYIGAQKDFCKQSLPAPRTGERKAKNRNLPLDCLKNRRVVFMKLNGQQFNLTETVCILDFLKSRNYSADRVAVELNGRIVPKTEFENTTLMDSDEVEIVCFVGGG